MMKIGILLARDANGVLGQIHRSNVKFLDVPSEGEGKGGSERLGGV